MNHEKIDTYNVIYCKIHDICLPYGGLETLVNRDVTFNWVS